MENNFVPYELALKLKELGFNEECLGGYDINNKWWYHPDSDVIIDVPLWQQAFDWCLDKLKLIESYAIIIDSDSYSLVIMDYYYNDIKENLTQSSTKIECLKKLIEIAKEKCSTT